jgi:tetratricopeptide (TPR) repeat protein
MAGLCPWFIIMLGAAAAAAQPAADLRICQESDEVKGLAACSRFIETPGSTPDDLASAYAARSYHYERMEDFEDALTDATRSIQLNPNVAFYYDNRSNAERMLGRMDDAFADASTALKLDPDNMPALLNRGLVYDARKDFDAALADFSKYIARRSDVAEPFTFRGRVHRERGEYELAIADFSKAVELKDDGTRPYLLRAGVYLRTKKYDLAIADFSAVLESEPQNAWALFGCGTAKARSGDGAAGKAEMDKARALDANIATDFANNGDYE